VRQAAAELIEAGAVIGMWPGVSVTQMSANRWRRALAAGGWQALASNGPPGGARYKLTPASPLNSLSVTSAPSGGQWRIDEGRGIEPRSGVPALDEWLL
jgi:hypothetical protein